MSPIFGHFSESIAGLLTLRAFRRQNLFLERNHGKLNASNQVYWVIQNVGALLRGLEHPLIAAAMSANKPPCSSNVTLLTSAQIRSPILTVIPFCLQCNQMLMHISNAESNPALQQALETCRLCVICNQAFKS